MKEKSVDADKIIREMGTGFGTLKRENANNKIRVVVRMRPFLENEQAQLATQSRI